MRRLSVRNTALAKVLVFKQFPRRELILLSRLADAVRFEAGEIVITEGRYGQEFYVITGGRAAVERSGSEVAVLGPGDHFGELAVLSPGPRTATVRAITPLSALVLTRRAFDTSLREVPELTDLLLRRLSRRLQELETG